MSPATLISIVVVLVACVAGVYLGREIASIAITLAVWFINTKVG